MGDKPKVQRPPGWYSRVAKEGRKQRRHARRLEREEIAADRCESARRRDEALRPVRESRARFAENLRAADQQKPKPRPVKGVPLRPGESAALYSARVNSLRTAVRHEKTKAKWKHKLDGTPETHEHASRTQQGPIARLFMSGHIDCQQLGWACEIASVAESIEADVAVRGNSYEMRVDYSGSGRDALAEGVTRVRREVAYTWWRERIPNPKRAVLDMLVGEPVPYSTIALQYRMGKKRARKLLIDALDLWPAAMHHAEGEVDQASLAAAVAGILGG